MNILALLSAIAFTINLTLCLIVLSSKRRNLAPQSYRSWALGSVSISLGTARLKGAPFSALPVEPLVSAPVT